MSTGIGSTDHADDVIPDRFDARAYNYLQVVLPAEVCTPGGHGRSVVIRGIGPTGLLVEVDDSSKDRPRSQLITGTLDLRCRVGRPPRQIHLRGEVSSREGNRIAVSVEGTDIAAVRALQQSAADDERERTGPQEPLPGGGHAPVVTLVTAELGKLLAAFIHTHLPAVFETAKSDIFLAGRNSPSEAAQAEHFDAMQEVERLRPSIGQGFVARARLELERVCKGEHKSMEPSSAGGELSLVDTNSLDDWLTAAAVVSRLRPRLRAAESDLAQQFSALLNREIHDDDNPLGVFAIVTTFHDALQNLGAEKHTRRALFTGLEKALASELGELQEIASQTLAALGFPPGAPAKMRAVMSPSAPPRGRRRDAGQPAQPASAQVRSSHAGPAPGPAASSGPVTPATPGIAPAMDPGRPGVASVADPARLLRLCGQLLGQQPGTEAAGGDGESVEEAAQADRLLAALQSSLHTDPAAGSPIALEEMVRRHFASHGLAVRGRVADTLATSSTLLEAMLADPLLDAQMADELRRLALPLLRALAQDPGFLTEPDHPVRRFIDDVGMMVADIAVDTELVGDVVHRAIDGILAAPQAGRSAFASALSSIALVLERQRQEVTSRVERLVGEREQQVAAVRRLRRADADTDQTDTDERARMLPAEWQEWLAHARRVSVGDAVLMEVGTDKVRPAWLVWVDSSAHVFLFANAAGQRAETLTREQLAMGLRRGAIQGYPVLSASLVERALQRVLGRAYASAEHEAKLDPVTGLHSRKPLEWHLARAIEQSDDEETPGFLALAQFDDFDNLARRCGSRASNRLLANFAEVLSRQLGEAGVAARLYGSRFALLLPDASRADALQRTERLRRTVEQSRCLYRGESLPLAVSIGVVSLDPRMDGPDGALGAAEIALKSAGDEGGNRVRLESFARLAPASGDEPDFAELLAAGRAALRWQRVQPLNADAGLLPYYEILLGIRQDDGSLAPPGRLIAAAEREGQIATLDRWVVVNAFDWMAAHPERVHALDGIAINLSGITLSDPTLLEFILQHLKQRSLDVAKVMFEVTEWAAIDNLSAAKEVMEGLRAQGCRFALDDFGAGNASFAYLKHLNVDKVKIDGMFVKDMVSNEGDRAMVRSINEIAHFMQRTTVAEFAESEAILEQLRALGVNYAQGYAIARPEPMGSPGN